MQNQNISGKQLWAWLFAAMSAPLAQMVGSSSWPMVLAAGAVGIAASWLVARFEAKPGKILGIILYVWILCVLSLSVRWIAESWPSGDVYPAVPLVLVVLAAVSAAKGAGNAARAGSMVFWFLALVFAVVALAGLVEIDVKWLAMNDVTWNWELFLVLLTPALVLCFREAKGGFSLRWAAGIVAFGGILSAMITGTLSPAVAGSVEMPLYQWVRGLRLFDVAQRFESVVAVALTMGWFGYLSFLLSAAGRLVERVLKKDFKIGIWVATVLGAGSMLING